MIAAGFGASGGGPSQSHAQQQQQQSPSRWSPGPTQPKQHRSEESVFRREFQSSNLGAGGGGGAGAPSMGFGPGAVTPFGGGGGSSHSIGAHSTGPNERMVDLGGGKTVKVNVVRGADGLEKGEYFDPTSNMKFTIQLHGDPVTTQTSTKVRSTSVSQFPST
jgi:hypothetical protein